MILQDRITISTEDIIQHLEQAMNQLSRFQHDSQYRKVLGETLFKHMTSWDEKIRARKKDPFTIVVVGEFKRGKSSFINALLGENILPTDVTSETMTMNRLTYGFHKNEAVLSRGRRLTLNDDELSRVSLEKLIEEIGEPIFQLELQRPNKLLKDIRIIDTPGMNDLANEEIDSIVAEAMAQADAIIYIYSVQSPLARSEQVYVKYVILPQNYTKLFMVGNRGDILENTDNLSRMKDLLNQRVYNLLSEETNYIISALDELCRTFGTKRPCPNLASELESEFLRLKKDITALIQEKKTVIAADRMQRMIHIMIEDLTGDLNNLEKGLEMSARELQEQSEELQKEQSNQSQQLEIACSSINNAVTDMQLNATDWILELLQKMEREDLSEYSAHDLLKYYSYYCIELLQEGLLSCLKQHREELIEQLSDISDTLGKGMARAYTSGDKLNFSFRLNNSTWTKGDSVTLAVTQLSGNSLINYATQLIGALTRSKEVESDKGKIIADIKSKYPELRKNIMRDIEAKYSALYHSARNILAEYYQEQIQYAEEAVAQYKEVAQKESNDKERISLAIAEMRETLNSIQNELSYIY